MKLARVFLETDMRMGFQGLHRLLSKNQISPMNLNPEHYYVFMNRARTKFKVISGHYLVYFNNGKRLIPLEAIQYLPKNFGGTQLEMSEAIRKVVLKQVRHEQ
jgi:hypothetical protein